MKFRIAVAAAAAFALGRSPRSRRKRPPRRPYRRRDRSPSSSTRRRRARASCQLTFVVQNDTGTVIEKSIYNIAIVDTDGAVSQLVNIEFRAAAGRPAQGSGVRHRGSALREHLGDLDQRVQRVHDRRRRRFDALRGCDHPVVAHAHYRVPVDALSRPSRPPGRGDPRCSTSSSPSSAPSAARC